MPLVELEVENDQSNAELIEDYWYWFWNWRFDPQILRAHRVFGVPRADGWFSFTIAADSVHFCPDPVAAYWVSLQVK